MDSKLGDSLNFSSRAKIALWFALVAIGVCGRLWQPTYNVTPFAAIGLAAGSLFGISLTAVAVPIVALVISNVALPGYDSTVTMALVVYVSLRVPGAIWQPRQTTRMGRGDRRKPRLISYLFCHNELCYMGFDSTLPTYVSWPHNLLYSCSSILSMDASG